MGISKATLDAMIAAATVDCYNEAEAVSGFCAKIEDNLAIPFETIVLGVSVTVDRVDLRAGGGIVAVCARGRHRQSIPILDLPLPSPPPKGAEWIAAYRYWRVGR